VEITCRSPSHAGLCDSGQSAVGLSGYLLPTGRYCIARTRNAGQEHTRRGGHKLWTHSVLMEQEDYRRFDCNPLHVQSALAETEAAVPAKIGSATLDPLPLPTHVMEAVESVTSPPMVEDGVSPDHFVQILAAVLDQRRLIVASPIAPLSILGWVFSAVPFSLRPRLSVSAGLKFALSRPCELNVIEPDQGQTERSTRGHDIEWSDLASPPPVQKAPHGTWLRLIRRWWSEARLTDIDWLISRLDFDVDTEQLERIAQICEDLDLAQVADDERKERISDCYATYHCLNPVETELVQHFLVMVTPEEKDTAPADRAGNAPAVTEHAQHVPAGTLGGQFGVRTRKRV